MDESLGQWGEDRATAFLKSNGFSIEERNLSTSLGECDILAWENETLVFVEVKTRRSSEFGPPEAAVTRDKREHLRRVAKAIISDMNREVSCRFDVISIEMKGKESDITHIKNAFEGTE